jgi:hypothetical protein
MDALRKTSQVQIRDETAIAANLDSSGFSYTLSPYAVS